jgi:hypothetical protein
MERSRFFESGAVWSSPKHPTTYFMGTGVLRFIKIFRPSPTEGRQTPNLFHILVFVQQQKRAPKNICDDINFSYNRGSKLYFEAVSMSESISVTRGMKK